ncbi:hypothetical protein Gpo141_00014530, partial [Globisporangium polare]
MPGRKPRRPSVGSNQIASILPASSPSVTLVAQSAMVLPQGVQGVSREQVLKHLSSFTTQESFSSLTSLRRLSIKSDSWREEFRRVGVFKRALWAMLVMLRNVFIGVGCALLTNYLCSIGTLSTRPPKEQSYTRFLAATVFWTHFFFCWVVFLIQGSLLVGQHFLVNPEAPATFLFCLRMLYNKTYISYCGSLVLLMATTYGVGRLLPLELREYKLEFYLGCVSGHVYTTNAIMSTRRIFQLQTVEGLVHLKRDAAEAKTLVERLQYFSAVFVKCSALALTVAFAGGFVHVVHHYSIASFAESSAFVAGCAALKFLIQEVMKMCVFSKKHKDIRTMWIAIGVLTVLIDTQVRIALQRSGSLEITLIGFGYMALAECVMRAIKVALTKLEVQRHERQSYPTTVSGAIQQFRREQQETHNYMMRRGSTTATMRLERWKERVLSFHTAE